MIYEGLHAKLLSVLYDHLSFVTGIYCTNSTFYLEIDLCFATTCHIWPKSLKGGRKTGSTVLKCYIIKYAELHGAADVALSEFSAL